MGFPGGSVVKNPPANAKDVGSIPGSESNLEKEMATHPSIFAWEITWTEEPGGLCRVHGVTKESDMTTTNQQQFSLWKILQHSFMNAIHIFSILFKTAVWHVTVWVSKPFLNYSAFADRRILLKIKLLGIVLLLWS